VAIVGTAGHVDHGKSTLVEALTGRDPDRWPEEKERGLTIDLGFAWADLGGDVEVAFVDVPGHERFIKNMLAGVGGIDVALLVVAADEGWMPQTEEHASVLDLLDVRRGVIALTRIDLVDSDGVELAHLEVDEQITGTALEGWPIVPVSAVTGIGLDSLRAAVTDQLTLAGSTVDRGSPRLWVDRSFVISGAGVVVTGTLTGGSIHRDDRLVLYPKGSSVRVRGLQSHERPVDHIAPGSRAAMNLAGIDRDEVARGALLAPDGSIALTRRALVMLRPVRNLDGPLTDRGAYHLHIGTAAIPVRARFIEEELALLTATTDIPAAAGDRFILRETGRRAVVAGGRVIDPHPVRRPSAEEAAAIATALDAGPDATAQALLDVHGMLSIDTVSAATGGGTAQGLSDDKAILSKASAAQLTASALDAVAAYHDANPLHQGIPKSSLASAMRIEPTLLDVIVAASSGLVDQGSTIRTVGFEPTTGTEDWSEAHASLVASLAVPRASQLGISQDLLYALIRDGALVRIADDLVYLPEQVEEIRRRLTGLEQPFTVSTFRDELGLSRRQAVPLLEWTDRQGWTHRDGDVRTVRQPPFD